MKIVVDRDACEGHGVCEGLAPELFEVGPDDQVILLKNQLEAADRAKIQAAVLGCPRAALKLEE